MQRKNKNIGKRRGDDNVRYPLWNTVPVYVCLSLCVVFLWVNCTGGGEKADYNVILISLDTTRADYVDTGVGANAYTPELRRFARGAVIFENAFCTIPQTLPSHLSMLTSYYPHQCGVYSNQYNYDGRFPMLQEVLKENGYRTAAIVSLGTLASSTGIAKGFDRYLENLNRDSCFFAPAEKISEEGLKYIKENIKNRFFLFLHYSDPHSPYSPPGGDNSFSIELDGVTVTRFNAYEGAILRTSIRLNPGTHRIGFKTGARPEDFDSHVLRKLVFSENCRVSYENIEYSKTHYDGVHLLKAAEGIITVHCDDEGEFKLFQVIPMLTWKAAKDFYRREVEYMDRNIGVFLRELDRLKLTKKTIVVIVGDHGEGLGERERYFGHVRYLNRQFIQVPFMARVPGTSAGRVTTPVSLVSVAPTVLRLLGLEPGGFHGGANLANLIHRRETKNTPARPVYSFAFNPSAKADKLSVISWPYQCIYTREEEPGKFAREYYHLELSRAFRKWDEYSGSVLVRLSNKDYAALGKGYVRFNKAFKKRKMARLNKRSMDMEKLKTMGYIH
jgi:membrane-anchored protein YejM (alkaline phosphatase superfamily)